MRIATLLAGVGLGFFAASLYTLLALRSGGGSWPRFWMGAHTAD